MKAFTVVALLSLTAAAVATGCSASSGDDVTGGSSAYTSDGGAPGAGGSGYRAPAPTGPTPIAGSRLTLPIPGSKNNRISAADQKIIVDAWLQAKKDYYDAPHYQMGTPPALAEVATVPCGGSYSYLVCRFYAHMPSYQAVVPNYRGCFSYMANGGLQVPTSLWDPSATTDSTTMRPSTYAEAFNHCLYQDYDKVLSKTPLWSTSEVEKNRAARNEIGVVKYMSDDIRAAFKAIMYTWYEPATYDSTDQAAIVNAVYGAYTPPATPPPVNAGTPHASSAIYIDAMNAYIAANKQL